MLSERRLKSGITKAVKHFWETRSGQTKKQQQDAGRSDQGSRSAVTGGKQMDGFVLLVRDIITSAGLSDECIHNSSCLELPGYFRPEKKWDLDSFLQCQTLTWSIFLVDRVAEASSRVRGVVKSIQSSFLLHRVTHVGCFFGWPHAPCR